MSADGLCLTLIANEGILCQWNGSSLLVDGVHNEACPFESVSPSLLEAASNKGVPFQSLDYLAFTHEHPDHFTPETVEWMLSKRTFRGIFLPNGTMRQTGLRAAAVRMHIPLYDFPKDRFHIWSLHGAARLAAFPCPHVSPKRFSLPHDCLLLDAGNHRVLFLGDADWEIKRFAFLQEEHIDCIVANPLWLSNPEASRILEEILRPREVIVAHIPPTGGDSYGYGRLAEQRANDAHSFRLHLFRHPGDTIVLSKRHNEGD